MGYIWRVSGGIIILQPSVDGFGSGGVWRDSLAKRAGRVAGCVPHGGHGRSRLAVASGAKLQSMTA